MSSIIRVIELASGAPCREAGCYLRAFDPTGAGGRGRAWWTRERRMARRFADHAAAADVWRSTSLRAYTVSIEDADTLPPVDVGRLLGG